MLLTRSLSLIAAGLFAALPAGAAAPARTAVKVGFLSTLSGPGAGVGNEIRDGFNLALKSLSGRLGGLPAQLLVVDDQQQPEVARKAAEQLVKKDKVDFMTGVVFSNVMLAVGPPVFKSKTFYLSANAGPSQYAGSECNPYFFSVAWQNDNLHEAIGKYVGDKGFKNVVLVVPDNAGGNDALSGFKRYYHGRVRAELRARTDQLDYAAELAQIRSLKPDAVYFYLPGGMGIYFVRQFVAAGLSGGAQLFAPGVAADEDVIKAVGAPMLGMFNSSHWAHDLENAENQRFVAAFEREYGRLPSLFAAQGYDTALLIDSAVRDVNGRLGDKDALRRALEAKRFKSVRGDFKFNSNHYPIQNYYLRVIGRDARDRITNRSMGTLLARHADAYAAQCPMR